MEGLGPMSVSKQDFHFFQKVRNTFFHPVYKGQKTKNKNNCSPAEQVKKERMIKMTKTLENKKLNLAAMENVTGGTVSEYSDLLAALSINPKLQKWGRFAAHLLSARFVYAVFKGDITTFIRPA